MSKPQFSLDGGQTWADLDTVRIVVPRVDDDPKNDEARDLMITLHSSGMKLDMLGVDSGVGYSTAHLSFHDLDGLTS